MKDIVIIGASGCAKEILWLLEDNNLADPHDPEWNILGFIDRNCDGTTLIDDYPILGDDDWLIARKEPLYVACGIGESALRRKIVEKLKAANPGLIFPILISRHAIMSKKITMGEGCIVCAGAILTRDIILGSFVTINLDCKICHDSVIGNYVTLNPSVNVSGNVTIGSGIQVGTGAKFIPGTHIGDGTIIGAGAIVIRDIPANCTAVGNPAKPIKFRE